MTGSSAPQFTILMAVYNASAYLKDAIESVRNQTLESWELLCIDDNSTDDSLSILRSYSSIDSRIHVFSSEKNEGPAKARNIGLMHAQGRYITMLDADDWLSPEALKDVDQVFDAHPDTDCVLFTLVEEYAGHTCLYDMAYKAGDCFTGKEAFRLSLDWSVHGLYAIRSDIHKQFPYDDSCRLHSDDNTTRIHYLHSREVRLSSGQYHYRKRPDSISFEVNINHFGYLDANLSMKTLLESERRNGDFVDDSDLLFYEQHRWLGYVDKHWYLFLHKNSFTQSEIKQIEDKLRYFYGTFRMPSIRKFGYTRYKKYSLFLLQEWLYFRMRWCMGRR